MSPARWNVALLVILVALLGLTLALTPSYRVKNLEFLPDMAHQPRFAALAENPYFANGMTLRQPVEGTVPRGAAPLGYGPGKEEAARAGRELASPIVEADRDAALARGEVVYARFCVPCHGVEGQGDGPVAQRGFPPPASLLGDRALEMRDGQIFHILTFGQGNMPAYASQIPREDRWRVVLFVRSLQERQRQPAPEVQ